MSIGRRRATLLALSQDFFAIFLAVKRGNPIARQAGGNRGEGGELHMLLAARSTCIDPTAVEVMGMKS